MWKTIHEIYFNFLCNKQLFSAEATMFWVFKIFIPFFANENIKKLPQKVRYFSRISLTAKRPKIKNSCSQMWLIVYKI